jgi:hypothetical protein
MATEAQTCRTLILPKLYAAGGMKPSMRRLSVVEELESVVSANLQRASRLRQSILQKAFSGQL